VILEDTMGLGPTQGVPMALSNLALQFTERGIVPDKLVRAGLTGDEAIIDHPGALRDEQAIEVVTGARP